jgi:hypothetical protein
MARAARSARSGSVLASAVARLVSASACRFGSVMARAVRPALAAWIGDDRGHVDAAVADGV